MVEKEAVQLWATHKKEKEDVTLFFQAHSKELIRGNAQIMFLKASLRGKHSSKSQFIF